MISEYKADYERALLQKNAMLARSVEVILSDIRYAFAEDLTTATVSATQIIKYQWVRSGMAPQGPPTNVTFRVIRTSSGWKLQ